MSAQTSNKAAPIQAAYAARYEAERRYEAAVQAAFPIGSLVHSGKSGRGIVVCKVLKHGFGDRLYVESQTGKKYWITAYHVEEAGLNDEFK